ncbi:hypothetical protein C8Q74DRAFT_1307279 [Fomes fomentarius]|nr:hypothetical protein C8Q74DRAFT_1307279 [Fomes fomentarius]
MSSDLDYNIPELVSDLTYNYIYNLCRFASLAMLLYDAALSSATEIEVIWSRKMRLVGCLHIVNRYAQIATYVALIVSSFTTSSNMCVLTLSMQFHGRVCNSHYAATIPRLGIIHRSPRVRTLQREQNTISSGILPERGLRYSSCGMSSQYTFPRQHSYLKTLQYLDSSSTFVVEPYPYGCSHIIGTALKGSEAGGTVGLVPEVCIDTPI